MTITSSQQLMTMHKKCKAEFEKYPKKVIVCCGTGCLANGARKIVEAFQKTWPNGISRISRLKRSKRPAVTVSANRGRWW